MTTYVESTKRHPRTKRDVKLKPFCNKPRTTAKTHGYDRRAQLLAYAKEMRNLNPRHLDCPTTYSSSESKERRWIRIPSPAEFSRSICRLFDRTSRQPWRYQHIESGEDGGFKIRNSQFCVKEIEEADESVVICVQLQKECSLMNLLGWLRIKILHHMACILGRLDLGASFL
ncbi:hypothetical protein AgCh_012782 [Apium graveolens]